MVVPPGVMHRGEQDLRMPTTLIGIVLALDARGATRNTPFTTRDLGWLRRHFQTNSLTVHPLGQDLRQTIAQLDRKLSGKKQNDGELSSADLRIDICSAISGGGEAVERRGLKGLAVYRECSDRLHACSPEGISLHRETRHSHRLRSLPFF